MASPNDRLWTAADLVRESTRLGKTVNRSHVTRLIQQGKIPAQLVGKTYVVTEADALKWLGDWVNRPKYWTARWGKGGWQWELPLKTGEDTPT